MAACGATDSSGSLQLINGLSKPKLINGAEITGPELAKLIEKMVAALNSREIPTAGSILEHFNKDLIQKVHPMNPDTMWDE